MPLDRRAAADALDEIAERMELRGDNTFRVRAFAAGARTVRGMEDFDVRVAAGTLTEVKGIGTGIAGEIAALAGGGRSPLLEELRAAVPEGLLAVRRVPGIGPKKARTLHDGLGIASLAELEYACRENRLKGLKGFGAKTQDKVLAALTSLRRHAGRMRRDETAAAEAAADAAARRSGGRAFAAGAYRRGEPLADGLDLVVSAPDPAAAAEAVLAALPVEEVVARDPRGTARARLAGGAELRLTVVPPSALGAALVAATGPEGHVRTLGRIRAERGPRAGAPAAWPTEEAFYADLGLPFVPPEARRDGEEIAAAARGALPPLLDRSAVLGAVHAHTTWSDGSGSVAGMLDAAARASLSWIGLSDHSRSATYAGGLTPERVVEQQREIAAEAALRPSLRVFRGTECDILGDGALDYDDATLDLFDFVVASVHSRFTMPRDEMTRRVIRALEDPHTTVLGHPTGRLLLGRDGYALDIPEVLRACARLGVAVELNSHPARLDLDLEWMPLVRELGVVVSLGPDAHDVDGFSALDHGVAVARRAALPPSQVLNTRDAEGARAFFRSRRAKRRRP